ncbi:MAG: UDP-N-acetylmuramoyl-L-alanyl-D-glutamate--2,6-diaminopimelate ligase [Phycisphaeraceae bacterium]|nr:MAG: UDP-N-acetylmuramoyl-L-alanyl-D-glutamate--2,6-diaminopimelate ligase [Phycisphaeraceae bacterium]
MELVTPGAGRVRVCDLTEDSRTVVPGSLFVARPGLKADGRGFVLDAAMSGAVAVLTDDPEPLRTGPACPNLAIAVARDVPRVSALLAERFYGNPSTRLGLMGVTGTNGKTTVSWLVWRMFNRAGRRCGLIGTVRVDDGVEVADAGMTTPPAMELSRSLARMAEAGCGWASLEVSSHALAQSRVAALSFRVGVFTNLTRDHLDFHGTMDAYARCKASLFGMLPKDATAVVNADDPAHAGMIDGCRAGVVRCTARAGVGAGVGAGVATVRVIRADMRGMTLDLDGPAGRFEAVVPLIGGYNAMNALQASVAAHAMGLSAGEIADGLEHADAPPGRLERVGTERDDLDVFVDYAHTDDGLSSVLSAVRGAMTRGRLWVVFGCGGDRDTGKRPRMGEAAARLADRAVVTSDNPRTEPPGRIIDAILGGIAAEDRAKVEVQADRARAIAHAVDHAEPGDVVVIAGKGHETEQILPDGTGGTLRTHFDDREIARQALAHRRRSLAARHKP